MEGDPQHGVLRHLKEATEKQNDLLFWNRDTGRKEGKGGT